MQTINLICLVLAVCKLARSSPDYYWREYSGTIPEDAVPGGRNATGGITYIGQSFVEDRGLLIGPITPGSTVVETSRQGIYHKDKNNKILCSRHKENLVWKAAYYKTLHEDFVGHHLVKGGVEGDNTLSIGRVPYHDELIIGKVLSGEVSSALMYFVYNHDEFMARDYEILVYVNCAN